MTQFYLSIGDEWDDGHGKYDKSIVEVPDQFTAEALRANLKENITRFGFNIKEDVARDYDDSRIASEHLDTLRELGFTSESDSIGWYINHPEKDEDYVHLCVDGYRDLLMFFYGYGLEGFEWKLIKNPNLETLNDRGCYGYGLFF